MNDELINDLKQFISATVLQATADIRMDIHELKERADTADEKLDAILDAVGEQSQDHEHRIVRLEHKAA